MNHEEIVDPHSLEEAIKEDFGMSIKELERVQIGYSNRVYKGLLEGREVFVRMQKDKTLYPVEVAIYRALTKQGLPVPEILGVQDEPSQLGQSTMILARAIGDPLGEMSLNSEQKQLLYFSAGQVLQKMHQIKIPGFGKLILKDEQLHGKSDTNPKRWQSVDGPTANFRYAGEHDLITPQEFRLVLDIWNRISHLEVDQASLVHSDYHGGHIFTDGQNITGLIDFTDATADDSRYDIANALFFQSPEERVVFRKGYGELAEDPMVHDYILFVAINKVGWRHKKGMLDGAAKALKKFREELES